MIKWTNPSWLETEQDAYRNLADALDVETVAQERGRHRLPCYDCGNAEGLVGWSREGVLDAINEAKYPLPRGFYVAEGYDPDRLYTRCPTCGKATDDVMRRCQLLTASDLAAWVLEKECNCVGVQTCTVCKLAYKIKTKWRL